MTDRQVPWDKHLYASICIPEADAEEIRSALETVLLGPLPLPDYQKALLVKLRERLQKKKPVTGLGPPKWLE